MNNARPLDRPVGTTTFTSISPRYAAAMIVTVQPQRPSVNVPSGTQPRERAMIAAITASRNER